MIVTARTESSLGGLLDRGQQVEPELHVPRVHRLRAVELDAQLARRWRRRASRSTVSAIRRASYADAWPTRRPRIGICTALERARWTVWDQEAYLLDRSYVDAIQAAGGLALMLPPDPQAVEDPDELLDLLDGLILAGG